MLLAFSEEGLEMFVLRIPYTAFDLVHIFVFFLAVVVERVVPVNHVEKNAVVD